MSTPNPLTATPSTGAAQLLTALQQLVTALNGAATSYANIVGVANFGPITSATVVKNSAGRICEIAVISAGTTTGYVYDSASTSATTATMIPIPNVVGVYRVQWPMAVGILCVPGTGQTISGTYS
jgi:hypothetical protein